MKNLALISVLALLGTQTFTSFAQAESAHAKKKAAKKAEQQHKSEPKKSYARPYGLSGCGLGSIWMGKDGNQILSGISNSLGYNQAFGISSGTSNCKEGDNEVVANRMDRFVVANKVALASDIARGSGETLSSLSMLLNCENSEHIGPALQGNFKHIFPTYEVQPNDVTDSIITVILNDADLADSCKAVI